jgi:hypothetical protein
MGPTTLSKTLEYKVNAYGEYGASRKGTRWQKAQQRYRQNRDDEEKPRAAPPRKGEVKQEVSPVVNWEPLGSDLAVVIRRPDTTTLEKQSVECRATQSAEKAVFL